MNIIVTRGTAPNSDLLTDQIKAAYPDNPMCTGISTKGARVTAHFTGDLTPEQVTAVEALITNHDETQNTSEQQAGQTRKAEIVTLNSALSGNIDVPEFAGLGGLPGILGKMEELAQRIRRLELRIEELEG